MKKQSLVGFLGILLILTGCGVIATNTQKIGIDSIEIPYHWNIVFQKSNASKEEKVLAIYEEEQEDTDTSFKDSLILAKQYDLGKGTLTFARDSLKLLKEQGLTLQDENEWKTVLDDHGKKRTLVIISYKITDGFLSKVPLLYMTQAFLEDDNEVYVFSHSTEEKSEQKNIVASLKNLTYL